MTLPEQWAQEDRDLRALGRHIPTLDEIKSWRFKTKGTFKGFYEAHNICLGCNGRGIKRDPRGFWPNETCKTCGGKGSCL